MIKNKYVTVYRIVTGLCQRNTDRRFHTSFLSLLLVLLAGSAVAQTQITGTVYRDFNADGVRSYTTSTPFDGEIGVGGVTVRLFNQNGLVATATSSTVAGATLGNYTLTVPASGTGATAPFRVQFTNLPAGFFPGPRGTGSGTNVQFVAGTSASNVNLGINYPTDYCQPASALQMAVPCYENGSGVGNTNPAFVTFGYTNNVATPEPDDDFRTQDLGATWGVAYQRRSRQVFTSAFVKRHVGLGPRGADGVYRLNYSGATPTLAGGFDLQDVVPANGGAAINLGTVNRTNVTTTAIAAGSAGDTQLPASRSAPNVDLDAFAKVGKVGYGGIDLTEDENSLWLVNLNQRSLLRVNATDPASLSGTLPAALVNQYYILPTTGQPSLTGAPTCTNGTLRPFGLKFYRGRGYLGCVCDAATSTTVRQPSVLTAYVLSFDPTNPTSFSTVLTVPLNYNREAAYRNNLSVLPGAWQRWTDTWNTDINSGFFEFRSAPQPILSDIEFAEDGSIVLGFADRFSHQSGTQNYAALSADRTTNSGIAAGDIIKATRTTTGYQFEGGETDPGPPPSNPLYPGFLTTDGAAGTGEFYWGDYFVNFSNLLGEGHYETATGGLTLLPGAGEVVSTVYDPTAFFTQGVRWFDQQTGTANRSYRVVESGNTIAQFGKASDLGDVELLCDPAPIEIGNRLFFDGSTATANGLQDNGSAGTLVAGAVVQLYRIVGGTATLVASTTTNAASEYYFNNANVPGGLLPNTAYEIRVPLGQSVLSGFVPTIPNAGTDEAIDSDGILVGTNAVIALTTGNYGENNHSYDIGFACPTITSTTASVTVCGGTTNNVLSVSTTAAGTNSIQFVFFSSPQSGTAMYTGGTSIGTATPVNGVATLTAPVGAVTTPTTIYVYALLNPVPSSTSCRPSAEIQVTVRPSPVGTATTSGTVTCAASATVSGSSSLTGTTSYAWSGPNGFTSTAQSFTTAVAGTYSLTVTTNGCADLSPATTTVTANTITPSIILNSLTLTCAQTSGTLTATVTNATSPTYRWNTGATTASITVTAAGPYSVTVTSANGCTATATTTVQSNTLAPVVSATNTGPLTCTNTTVTVGASTTTAGATYRWNTGITTPSFTTTTAGTYSVTVTAPNGCTATASTTVTQDVTPPQALILTVSRVLNCTAVTAVLTASSSTTGVTYRFAGPGVVTTAGSSATVNAAGTYSVTATGTNGCIATTTATVTQDITPPQNLNVAVSRSLNCTATTAVLTASSSTTGVTYTFTGPGVVASSGSSATVNVGGTYSVTATAANGCTAITTATVAQDVTTPVVSATNTGPLTCTNTSVTVSASTTTANATYRWSSGQTTASFTTATAGTYSVTVTAPNGCTAAASTSVAQDVTPPQNLSLTVSGVLTCTATTAVLTASSSTTSVTYRFAGPGVVATAGSSATVNVAGIYSVTATGANGCTATTSIAVTQDVTTPVVSATNTGPLTCTLTAVTVSASTTTAGATYRWSSGQTTASFTTSTAGTYSVTVTAPNGCTAVASTIVIQDITTPQNVSLAVSRSLNCTATTAVLTASSSTTGVTYRFAGPGIVVTNGASATVNAAGTYSVTVTGANGCTAITTATVTQDITTPVVSATNTGPLTCTNTSVTVSASTPTAVSYRWTGPGSFTANTPSFTTTTTGIYSVTVTSSTNGCTATASTTVIQDIVPPQNVSLSVSRVLNCTATTAVLTASSSTTGVTYTFAGPGIVASSGTSATINAGGNYAVTATSANGCTATASASVAQDITTPVVSVTNTGPLTCTNTTVTVSASTTTANATYRWSSGQTTASFTTATVGTYSVTVTAPNGCTVVASTSVAQDVTPPQNLSLTVSGVLTCTATTAVLTASSSTTSVTYRFAGPGVVTTAGSSATVNAAGTYSVTVTSANGCTATISTTVQSNTLAPVVSATNTGPLTCTNTTVTVSASTTTAGATYRWNTGITTASFTTSTAGTYSVTVTAPNGCTTTATTTVQSDTATPTAFATNDGPITCAKPTVTVSVSPTAVGATYQWSTGQTTPSFTTTVAGTYSVTVTGANGCTAVAATTVTQPPALSVSTTQTNPTCNGGTNGSITVTATGGTPAYQYAWSTGATTPTVSSLTAGVYSVTVTDANACTLVTSVTLTQPTALSLSAAVTNVACNGAVTGRIDLTVTGGTTPYRYAWSTGAIAEDIVNVRAGSYTVTVTDQNNCVSSLTATITEPPALTLTINAQNVTCNGGTNGSIDLTVAGGTTPYSYSWTNGSGQLVATTQDLTNLSAGTYTILVTDANACTATSRVNVSQPAALTVSTTKQDVRCNGAATGSIDLTVAGGAGTYSYRWTNGSGQVTATTQDLTGLTAGVYSVTVTDANACTATTSVTINQPTALSLTTSAQNPTCNDGNNGTINLTVSGGTGAYAYVWNDNVTSEDRTGLRAGTYSVIVTDANGCTATTSVTLTQPDVLSISGFVQPVTCFGGSNGAVSLTVTGGTAPYSFSWSNGATTQTIANVPAGNYTVTVTDANGCRQAFTAAVTQPDELVIDAAPIQIACPGQTVAVVSTNVQGGVTPYAYQWTGPNNFTANTPSIFNVPAGSYTLVVTDANSCTAVEIIDIVQPPPFNLSAQVTPVSCFGGTNGAIDVTVTGASPPYSFTWSNGARTEDLTGIISGTYSVSVTDRNGCMTTISAFVDQPTQLVLSETHTNVSCFDGQNGTIDLTVSGGTAPYAYAWSDNVTSEDRTNLRAGTYTVTVTDANGCTATTSVTITQPPAITLTAQISNVACNGGSNGAISLTVTGGTGALTYRWSTGATTAGISGLTAGVYSVTVTDQNQCVVQGQFRVDQPDALQITFTQQNIACFGAATGRINVNVTGGTTPYQYAWNDRNGEPGTTTEDRTDLTAGVYSLTVTDANNCTATISVTINQPPALTLTTTQQNVRCFGEANGTIDVTTGGGVAPYAFRWNDRNGEPGTTTEDRTGLVAGVYSLTVTDNNGCTATTSATITQPDVVTVTATNTGPLTCTLTTVTVSASSLPGVSYQWSGPAGFASSAASFTTATPGTYVVVVTGVNGCSATAQTVVGQDITTPVVSANNTGPITCANPTATVSVISNLSNVTYRWSSGQTTASFTTATAGTYSVTVTAPNGCTATASTIVSQTLVAATLAQGSCNFNGTNSTAADDYFLITVQATSGGSNAPNRYEVVLGANADGTGGTVLNPGGTPFDQPVTVGSPTTFRADGATTYTLTIRDINSSGCNVILTTTPVASCSSCEEVLCPRVSVRKL